MPKKENLWYQVGYALETVRNRLPTPTADEGKKPLPVDDVSHKVMDALLTVGAGSVLTRTLSFLPSKGGPSLFRLFRGGIAGSVAAFLAELARPGRGLLYAALVEPRVPGPPILQGAMYGGLEYALMPWGGLGELAGSRAPQGKIPALAVLLKDRGADEKLIEHIAFGVALALLYDR